MKHLSRKTLFIICGVFALLAIGFTLAVHLTGLREMLSSFGYSEMWYKITKYSGYALFLPVAFLIILGFVELIKRKSFKKVDRELKLLALFYVAVGAVYIFFEKLFVINYRPIMLDGKLESSYPSSHTLFAVTLCGSAMLINRALLKKNQKQATVMNLLLLALALVTIVGRLLSGVHWATDIIGGVLIGLTLVFALAALIKKPAEKSSKVNKESE